MPKLLLVLELEGSPTKDLVNLVNHYQNSKNIKFELWLITNDPSFRNCFDYGAQKIFQNTHKNPLETVFAELISNNSDYIFFLDSFYKIDHAYSDNILALLQSSNNLASARGSILTKIQDGETIQENWGSLGLAVLSLLAMLLDNNAVTAFYWPLMDSNRPESWLFILSYVFIGKLTILNLIIAILIDLLKAREL